MKFDVYGRFQVEVVRENDEWVVYKLGLGTRARSSELIIPSFVSPSEVARYLDDELHELSGPGQCVRLLSSSTMSSSPIDREHWSRVARAWIEWARLPGHDAFWAYRESLVNFVGPGDGEALDIGCGEGRVSRVMKGLGYRVTASDPVAELVKAAVEIDSAHAYAVADASALPFADSRFDLIVAYNVLMDLDNVPATLREMRRVLRPSGQLVISLVHPFSDRGTFSGTEPDSPFVLRGTYFGRQRFEGTEERNGLQMHFAGWSQPLEAYASALEFAGLAITSLREPIPDPVDGHEYLTQWTRVPLFLWLKARRL